MTPIRSAEYPLSAGLAGMIAATALFELVILGLLSLLIAPLALALLLVAGVRAQDVAVPELRAVSGFVLFVGGVALLAYASVTASGLAYSVLKHGSSSSVSLPSMWSWAELVLWCLASAAVVMVALALRTRYSLTRVVLWGCAFFATAPLGFVGVLLAALVWPIAT